MAQSGDSSWVKKGAYAGMACAGALFYQQHVQLEMDPVPAVVVGAMVGAVPGSLLGHFIENKDGKVSGFFYAVGALSGGFLGLSIAAHVDAEWWAGILAMWIGGAIGAAIGEKLWILLAVIAALVILLAPGVVRTMVFS